MVKKYFYLIVVILFSLISCYALFHSGLPPTHDGEYHVVRFYEFDKVLRSGVFYPRWASDLNKGYGVPLFNYVYPFSNYFASFLHAFGMSFIDSFKINMIIATIVGGVFFFLWSREYWKEVGGAISAIFYLYSPYRFVDVFVRGSVGEIWALAFLPGFLWAIKKIENGKTEKWTVLASLLLAFIIFSHNILALMFSFFGLFYGLILLFQSKNRFRFFLHLGLTYILGLGLSSIFWIPALLEITKVVGLKIYNIKESFVEVYQLIFPSWGTGFSTSDLGNQMSLQIGVGNLIVILASIGIGIWLIHKKHQYRSLFIFFLSSFFIVFFLMLSWSQMIWEAVPFMNFFQFPWRFLSLEIVICSFLAGCIPYFFRSKILIIILFVMPILLGIGYAHPAYYLERPDTYYTSRENFISGTNSPGNVFNTIWFNTKLKYSTEKINIEKEKGEVSSQKIEPTRYFFNLNLKNDQIIIVQTAYFPGWEAKGDNEKITVTRNKDGLISINVKKTIKNLKIFFASDPIMRTGELISLLSLLFLFIVYFSADRRIKSIEYEN